MFYKLKVRIESSVEGAEKNWDNVSERTKTECLYLIGETVRRVAILRVVGDSDYVRVRASIDDNDENILSLYFESLKEESQVEYDLNKVRLGGKNTRQFVTWISDLKAFINACREEDKAEEKDNG